MTGLLRGTAAALISVTVACAATYLSWPLLQPTPMALFYAAVLASSWFGGVRGGLLAVVLSAAVGYFVFLPPYGSFGTDPKQILTLAVFFLVASSLVWLIAAQQRTAASEREQRRWFAGTLSSVGDAVIATDTGGRITFMNDVAEKLTGWKSSDAAGRELEEVFSIFKEGTREKSESPVKRALETGRIVGLANHTVLVSKAGNETAIEDSAAPIKDDEGTLRGVILVFRDASEKRRAELAAEEAQRQTTNVLESINEAFVAMDSEFRHTYANEATERVIGMKREELLGRTQWEVFPGTVGTEIEANYRRVAAERVTIEFENFYVPWQKWYAIKACPGRDGGIVLYFSDITARKKEEQAKEYRAKQLRRLADISARINAAHDVESVVRVVTEEARHLVGARQSATSIVVSPLHPEPLSVISTPVQPVHVPEDPGHTVVELYEVVNAENQPVRIAQSELAHDPRWQTLQKVALVMPSENGWLAAPLIARSGQSLGLIQLADKAEGEFTEDDEAILVQLSRLASIAIENARLYEELRGNDQRKDEFLAMLAHELRNPLAAIGNAVSVTTLGGVQEHIEWSMDVIARQMKHLTRLIDDLMDVSRISRGKIELRRDIHELTPILDSAAATARPLIEERKHRLELDIDRGNLWANVDPTRLEQVVVNLLNNAAKYSENGGHIHLSARVEGGEVVLSVKDHGVGIPPEKLPEMFELFAQGDRTLARSEGGLGIGLTVVKKLVEMHGGNIAATSGGKGTGSEFTIRLPLAPRPAVKRAKDVSAVGSDRKSARILVVDDNVDTARGMARLLKLLGHEVAIAHSGPEGIEAAREHRPDFVLLDIGLPGMDGYEVASRLRREDCCKDAVIIAISGYGQDEDRRRSKEAGFDHHLIKPLDHDALISLLSVGADGRG